MQSPASQGLGGHKSSAGHLDLMLIFGEAHLRQTLSSYAAYYNKVRTHLYSATEVDTTSARGQSKVGLSRCRKARASRTGQAGSGLSPPTKSTGTSAVKLPLKRLARPTERFGVVPCPALIGFGTRDKRRYGYWSASRFDPRRGGEPMSTSIR
jgi:hypothetical protein